MALELTYADMESIIDGEFEDRFKIHSNKIPYDSTDPTDDPMNSIEDDGRQLRYFEFEDLQTGATYSFTYVWHGEWGFDVPHCILNLPNSIVWIKESKINPPKPVVEPVVEKTAEQLADEAVWAPYRALESAGELRKYAKGMVPEKLVRELRKWLKTERFNMYGLRAKFIPICVEYKVDQQSFWQYVQGWSKK
jgi:hypothetical protein